MKLINVSESNFDYWGKFRKALYSKMTDDYNAEEMSSILEDEKWHCQLVEDESGEMIGMVEISLRNLVDGCISSPVPYLEGLYLIPEQRGKGLGKQIIKETINWCRASGYQEFATDAELSNTRAHSFYQDLGFEETDRVVQFKYQL